MFTTRIKRLALATALATSVFSAPTAFAESTIKLAGPEFPPYYEMVNGRMSGHLAEILEKIVETAGEKWTGELFPAPRLMHNLVQGEDHASLLVRNATLDDAPSMLRSPKPITEMVLNVYTMKTPMAFKSRDDFKGKSLIVMRGYGYGSLRAWLDKPENNVTIVEANTHESAVRLLEAGRAEAALLYDVNYAAAVTSIGEKPADVVTNNFQRIPLFIYLSTAASLDATKLMGKLMAAYDQLVKEGVLNEPDKRPEDVVEGKKSS